MNRIPVMVILTCTTTACSDGKEIDSHDTTSIDDIIGTWRGSSYRRPQLEEEAQSLPLQETSSESIYGISHTYSSRQNIFLDVGRTHTSWFQTYEETFTVSVEDEIIYESADRTVDEFVVSVSQTSAGYEIDLINSVLSCNLTDNVLTCQDVDMEVVFEKYENGIPEEFSAPNEIILEPEHFEDNGACYDADISGTEESLQWGLFSDQYDNSVTASCPGATAVDGPDLAFRWAAQSAGCYLFTTQGSTLAHTLSIKESCGEETLQCGSGHTGSRIVRELSNGEMILIVLDSASNDDTGEAGLDSLYNLSVVPYEPQPISTEGEELGSVVGDAVASGSNAAATVRLETECGQLSNGLLFRWTAPQNGVVEVSSAGSDFDTILQLYPSRCSLGECNDDGDNLQSKLSFEAAADEQYDIVLGGKGDTGSFTLNIHYTED